MDEVMPGYGIVRRRPVQETSASGVLDDARTASAEKGAKLLDGISGKLAEHLARPENWG